MYFTVLWHCFSTQLPLSVVSSFLASPITRLSIFLFLWASSSCQILCIPLDVSNGEIKEPRRRKALSAADEWIIVVPSLRAQPVPYAARDQVPADQIFRKGFSEGQFVLPPQGGICVIEHFKRWQIFGWYLNAALSATHDGRHTACPMQTAFLFYMYTLYNLCTRILLCIFHCNTWNYFAE